MFIRAPCTCPILLAQRKGGAVDSLFCFPNTPPIPASPHPALVIITAHVGHPSTHAQIRRTAPRHHPSRGIIVCRRSARRQDHVRRRNSLDPAGKSRHCFNRGRESFR